MTNPKTQHFMAERMAAKVRVHPVDHTPLLTAPEVVVDQLWGAGYHRLLIPDQPLNDEFARALVQNLMHGLRPECRVN